MLDLAAERCRVIMEAQTCALYALADDALECVAASSAAEEHPDLAAFTSSLSEQPESALAAESTQLLERDHGSSLAVPLLARGRVFGTLELTWSAAAHDVSPEEEATAEACARVVALAVDNATLYQAQLDHARRLTSLLHAGRAVTSSLVIDEVLAALVRTAATSLGSPEALIFEYDADADTLTMRSIYQEVSTYYEELDQPYSLEDYPSDRLALESGDVIIETISDPDLPVDVRESMEVHDEKTCLTVPLRYGAECLGLLVLIETRAERGFDEAELEFARGFGEQAAMALHNARLFENVKRLHLANLRAVSSALTAKDFYTVGHAARVAAYAVLLAAELGWSTREIQQLEEVAYLHDVGKITVADRVLLKQGALTDEEWTLMRQHPVVSAEIIEALFDEAVVAGVRHHHERYDGGGYPGGLIGEEIPIVARVLCIVDAYDAMSSRRIYRPALSYDECLKELRDCSASQFDPGLVEPLARVLAQVAAQRRELQAAADDAAARIDIGDHLVLVRTADEACPEFSRVRAVLDEVRRAHPVVDELLTEAPEGELRYRVVVDSDPVEETRVPTGVMAFADDLELETFAGRALRRQRPDRGRVGHLDVVRRSAPRRGRQRRRPGGRGPPPGPRPARRHAAGRGQQRVLGHRPDRRRAPDESGDRVHDGPTHRALQPPPLPRAPARAGGRGAGVGGPPGPAVLRHRPLQAAQRRQRPSRGGRRAAAREPHPCVVGTARRRGRALRRRRVLRSAPRRRHGRGAGGRRPHPRPRRRAGPAVRRGADRQHRRRDPAPGGSAEDLLADADRAMYAAKEAGRDRVVRADTWRELPPDLPSML